MLKALLPLYKVNLNLTLEDVETLLKTHDAQTKNAKGRPPARLEVFKRSAFVLTITVWEAFIKDALRVSFDRRLEKAKQVKSIEGTFNRVAAGWLDNKPTPPGLAAWTGDGWKKMLKDSFRHELDRLHTPNTKNLSELSKKYLDFDLTSAWYWSGASVESAQKRLDSAIKRRGDLVRNGKKLFEQGKGAKRSEVVALKDLVNRLADCTIKSLAEREVVWAT